MSAFFPFELEPPPWIYRLLSRMGLMQRLYRRVAADLVEAMPTGGLLVDVGAGPGHLLQRRGGGDVRTFVWRLLDWSFAMLRPPRQSPGNIPISGPVHAPRRGRGGHPPANGLL